MVTPRDGSDVLAHLAPRDAQRLRQACANVDNWPTSWCYNEADVTVGQQIVAALTPFMLHLFDAGLAPKTARWHLNNLWPLGGELIRRRYDDSDLARQEATAALQHLVDGNGGPLIYPRISKSQQDDIDATCRKLHRFMSAPKAPTRATGRAKTTHK